VDQRREEEAVSYNERQLAVFDLSRHLADPFSRQPYERFRAALIDRYGYDWFRDTQNAAFKHLLYRVEPSP